MSVRSLPEQAGSVCLLSEGASDRTLAGDCESNLRTHPFGNDLVKPRRANENNGAPGTTRALKGFSARWSVVVASSG